MHTTTSVVYPDRDGLRFTRDRCDRQHGDPGETVGLPDRRGALARGKFARSGQKKVA
jgi:hypothetical protein